MIRSRGSRTHGCVFGFEPRSGPISDDAEIWAAVVPVELELCARLNYCPVFGAVGAEAYGS